MNWKILKLVSVVLSVVGIGWYAGGQAGQVIGLILLFFGVGLFVVCRIFEPTFTKNI